MLTMKTKRYIFVVHIVQEYTYCVKIENKIVKMTWHLIWINNIEINPNYLDSDIDTLDQIVVPADDREAIPKVDQLQPRN